MALAADPVPRWRSRMLPDSACRLPVRRPLPSRQNATSATPLRNARERWLRLRHASPVRSGRRRSQAAVALRQPDGVACPAMKLSAEKKRKFCEALVRGQTPDLAAQAIGINRATAYRWRDSDPNFAAAWLDAREHKTEVVENVLYRKAVAGEAWAVCFFLRGHRPELFNRRQQIALGGDAEAPPIDVVHAVAGEGNDRVMFYYPDNGRHLPARDDPAIEASADDEAA